MARKRVVLGCHAFSFGLCSEAEQKIIPLYQNFPALIAATNLTVVFDHLPECSSPFFFSLREEALFFGLPVKG